LLPGYFDTVTVFIVFAGCAMFSAVVLLPHWNSRPAVIESSEEQSPVQDLKALRT
jgi:sugar phosphate permease